MGKEEKKIIEGLNLILKGDGVHYNGYDLMSKTDLDGNKPEWYLCTGNRSSGKTTFFLAYLYKKIFTNECKQIMFLCRYKYELETASEQFIEPLRSFINIKDFSVGKVKNIGYVEIKYKEKIIAYMVNIGSSDSLKKISNLFNGVGYMYIDEFQSESGKYIPKEVQKLQSIHVSVARGIGKSVRWVPIICASNAISMLNPIMVELEAYKGLNSNTKFKRGFGYVLEQNLNIEIMNSQLESGFNRAIKNSTEEYLNNKDGQLKYLVDNSDGYGKIEGRNRYVCTIKNNGKEYAIRFYYDEQKFFVGGKIDKTDKNKYSTDSECIDYMWTMPPDIGRMRKFYLDGKFVFSNIYARDAFLRFCKI